MPIKIFVKKPQVSASHSTPAVNKKAHPPAERKERGSKTVVLRVPARVLREIDEVVARRLIRIPRHTWLLEALLEKLRREKKDVL